jgi:hypothetical protein
VLCSEESKDTKDLQSAKPGSNACLLSALGTRRNVVTAEISDSCFLGQSVRKAPNCISARNRRSGPLLRIYADLVLHRDGLS